MGAQVNGVLGLSIAFAIAVGCGGRSQRIGGDDDEGHAANGGDGRGGSVAAGTGGESGVGGTISTGGGAVPAGGAAGVSAGTGGFAGAGNAAGAGGSGAAGAPPLGEPLWFASGSLPLSRRAYQRTIARLLGLAYDETLPRERMMLQPGVDPKKDALELQELTEIAQAAVNEIEEQALLEVLTCADDSRACGESIVSEFAPRAWRRPLDQSEREGLLAVFDSAALEPETSPVKLTVLSVLRSANAQWLRAVGTADERGALLLDDYEIAGLMSYGFTGLPPDDHLRLAAESGQLRDPSLRRAEAERLFQTPEGIVTYRDFVRDWFRIDDAASLWFYEEEPELAEAFQLETNRFIEAATFEDRAPVSELLSASWSMLPIELIQHYGIMTMSASPRVDLSATRRRGILHHGSFLTSQAQAEAPRLIRRSMTTLSLLCVIMQEPPVDLPPVLAEPGKTYRETLSQNTAQPVCFGCHAMLDPIAFAFGKFDNRGAFVEFEGDLPIDSTGSVDLSDGLTFTFDDSADLALQLAAEPRLAECFNRNAVRSFVGVGLEEPAMTDYVRRFASDGAVFSMFDTLLSWAESEHFVRRAPVP